MFRGMVCLALLTLTGSWGLADDIWLGQLPYTGVNIVDVSSTSITFTVRSRRLTKPLADVTKVYIRANDQFNRAEDLLVEGRFDEALAAYKLAERAAVRGWEKALIGKRRQVVEKRRSAPTAVPVPTTTPVRENRCYYCRGSGMMPCTRCLLGRRSTGRGRCPDCNGRGRTPCPSCEGDCCKRKCTYCGGDGKVDAGRERSGPFIKDIVRDCYLCGGSGYADYCSQCGGQSLSVRGTVSCAKCGGTGYHGDCAACRGTKTIPCTHCEEGRKLARADESADRPGPDSADDAQTTPEALVATAPETPDTTSLTALQAQQVRSKHRQELQEWAMAQRGKQLVCPAEIEDVVPDRQASAIYVSAISDGGTTLSIRFPMARQEELAKLAKNQRVMVKAESPTETSTLVSFATAHGTVLIVPLQLKGIEVSPPVQRVSR